MFVPGNNTVTVSRRDYPEYNCTFVITVIPPTTPVCPDPIILGSDPPDLTANITWTYPTSNDLIDLYPLEAAPLNGSIFQPGETTVTVSRMDFPDFNCTFLVTVIPPITPVCPDNVTLPSDPPTVDTAVSWFYPSSNNYTDYHPLVSDMVNGSMFTPGETIVTVSRMNFPDINCTFAITIIPPTIPICPDNITVGSEPPTLSAPITWVYPSSNDNTDIFPLVSDMVNGSMFNPGDTVVTVSRMNFSDFSCTFTVTVIPPTVPACPADIVAASEAPNLDLSVTWINPPNNNTDLFPLISDVVNGSTLTPGDTIVTISRMNFPEYNCTFTISIIPPITPVCPADIAIGNDPGAITAIVTWTYPLSNNYTDFHPLISDMTNGSAFSFGNTTVTISRMGFPDYNCSFIISVIGPRVPVCPNNTVFGNDWDLITAVGTWNYPPENDMQDRFPLISDPVNGSTFNLGAADVLVSVDGYPLLNCTFTVTVEDIQPPEFPNDTRPDGVLIFGNSDTVGWEITAIDNAGAVTLFATNYPGDNFPLGDTNVTYTARDTAGLETTFTFIIRIIDDGSPIINDCPADISLEVLLGQPTDPVTWIEPTATGAGNITRTSDYYPGAVFQMGTTKVTYTFTNEQGNFSVCTFRVIVTELVNMVPPTVTCPNDVTVEIPPGIAYSNVTWVDPVFESRIVHVQRSKKSGTPFKPGTTQVIYIVMDANYVSANCMFTVTVNVVPDNDPPEFQGCPMNQTEWISSDTASAPVSWIPPNATDTYLDGMAVSTHNPGDMFLRNTDTEVTYTATDLAGNTASCSFFVSVMVDAVPPTVTCPPNITRYVSQGVMSLPITWADPIAEDVGGAVTVTAAPASGAAFTASATGQNDIVIVTARDVFGNTARCSFIVNVIIHSAPVLTCPNVLQDTLPGLPYADVSWPGVSIVDDITPQANIIVSSSETPPIRLQYSDEPVSVTITATDEMGNVGSCTFTVAVQDVEVPVWTVCPADITQAAVPGTNTASISWTAPTVSDNSGETPVIIRTPSSTLQSFSAGTWPISYAARDSSGNEGTCDFSVIVTVDQVGPVFTNCPTSPIVVNTDTGSDMAQVAWGTIEATDTDGPVTITSNYASGTTFDIGSYSVEVRAVDQSGNVAVCNFVVTVVDNENPAFITCPNSVTVYTYDSTQTVPVTWTEPTASDNSGVVTLSANALSGSRFSLGSQTVTYVARDTNGNTVSTCQFTVTVSTKLTSEMVQLNGEVTFDTVRGLNGVFSDNTRFANLQNDLNDYFRTSTALAGDFIGLSIVSSSFNSGGNLRIQFSLYLCRPAFYNEEAIAAAFEDALTNSITVPPSSNIVRDSFDLLVREYNGEFTLRSIVSPGTVPVEFSVCCTDPTSASYLALEGRIQAHLLRVYGNMPGFAMLKVKQMRAGSVVVPFTVTFDTSDPSTTMDVMTEFNNDVTAGSLELSSGVDTGLYLQITLPYITVQEVCPDGFCVNGGQCVVLNATFTYDYTCENCNTGFSGERCELGGPTGGGTTLSTGAIVGIILGILAFLLLLLLCCCCVFFLLGPDNRKRRPRDVYVRPPIMLMPQEPYVRERRREPKPQGPIITEVEEGPRFFHGDNDVPKAAPLALPMIAPAPAPARPPPSHPVSLGPSFLHEQFEDEQPPPRERESRRRRFRAIMPDRLPQRRSRSGPRFHGEQPPEPVEDMKRRLFYEFNY